MHSSNSPIPAELIRLLGCMSNAFIPQASLEQRLAQVPPVPSQVMVDAVRKHNMPVHWRAGYKNYAWLRDIRELLLAYNRQRIMFGLQLKKEWLAITKKLQQHGIAFMWVKGFMVQERFYPGDEHRFFNDLDMLVQPSHIPQAIQVLSELDYVPMGKMLSGRGQHHKNIMLKKKGYPVVLEVHYSLLSFFYNQWTWTVQKPHLQPIRSPEGLELNTFSTQQYLVYMALHGSVHRWHRLFWLRDMVMALHSLAPERVYEAYRQMETEGTQRSLALAIALAHDIFQCPTEAFRSLLGEQEKVLRKLKKYCLHAMQYRNIMSLRFRWQKLLYYRLLYPGYRVRLRILWHIVLRKLG